MFWKDSSYSVCLVVFSALALATSARAGDGVVALQTAAPSCADNSGDIYVDCGNGTVTDNRSGLVWLKDANCLTIAYDWDSAVAFVSGLSDLTPTPPVTVDDDCGLTDGSSPGEWRLPSVSEWQAMIADALGVGGDPDCISSPPTITDDSGAACHASVASSFTNVQADIYWTATSNVSGAGDAWVANIANGMVGSSLKSTPSLVWPVRGGQ